MLTEPGRYDYLPLIDRPKIRWPNGARVAFWVCPNIEFYEFDPPDGQGRPIWPRPYPDVLNYSLRDYGNRSGVWRVMEALERFGVRASVSLNAAMCDHMPEIVDECVRLNWELFSHGIYNTRLIYGMSEDEIRQLIGDSVRNHQAAQRPRRRRLACACNQRDARRFSICCRSSASNTPSTWCLTINPFRSKFAKAG